MATKTFAALPSWNDVESSPSYQAADPKSRERAFDMWQQDFVATAVEDPDNFSPAGWEQFKQKRTQKLRELRGDNGFKAATEEADAEAAAEAPDRVKLAARRRELETKAATTFGASNLAKLTPEERDEFNTLKDTVSASDDDDLDAVEEVANDDREFHVANGQFYASPSLALSTNRYREAVKNAPLTTEQKAEAMMKGKSLREDVGARLRGEITNMEDAFEGSIWGSDKFRQFESDLKEGNPDATDADVMEKWQEAHGSWYSNLGTQIKLGALRGMSDTIGAYYGVKRLVGMDDEETVARAGATGQLSGELAAASRSTGGATLASDAASMVVSSLATAPAGLGGRGIAAAARGLGGVAGRTAAAATAGRIGAGTLARAATLKAGGEAAAKILARQAAISKAGGLAAASFAAGMQSAGGAFNQYYDQFLQDELSGIPEDQRTPEVMEAARRRARDGARGRAIVSGLITSAITAGFGATGAEKLAAPNITKVSDAAKQGMFSFLAKSLGKEALSEASEEGLDELVNGVVDKLTVEPGKPVSEIVKDTVTAAVAGGLLGAGMSAPFSVMEAYMSRREAKKDPAVQAQLDAADALRKGGAPLSASVVEQNANADIQSNLDKRNAEAQQAAEAALTETPNRADEIQKRLAEIEAEQGFRDQTVVGPDGAPVTTQLRANTTEEDALLKELDALNQPVPVSDVEATDPFSAAPTATESPVAQPAEPTDATVGPQPTPGGVGAPPAPAAEATPAPTLAPAAEATPAAPEAVFAPAPAAPTTLAAPVKTPPKKPQTSTTDDTQAKEPPAGGIPTVEGQPAVRVQEGQTETGAPSGPRQGKAVPGKTLTNAERRANERQQVAALAERLAAGVDVPAVSPKKRGAKPAPTAQQTAEQIIEAKMFEAGSIPSSSVVTGKLKALTGKGLSNGSPAMNALMSRLRTAWETRYPSEGGTPENYFVGSVDGPDMKAVPKKQKAINDAGGKVPYKTVNGERVGFYTNDPILTAKQLNAGLKVNVPVELRGKVAPGIKIDEATGNVTAAYDLTRGDTPVMGRGEWTTLYRNSSQRAERAATLLVEGEKVAKRTGKTLEELTDDLRRTTNLINAMVAGKKSSSPATIEVLKKEKEKAQLVDDVVAMAKSQNPRIPFVGTDAYLAQHAPAEMPGENDLLTAYLRLGARLGLSEGVEDTGGLTYVQNIVRKTVTMQWPSLLESDMLTAIDGAVINDATVRVRKLLMQNPGVDPATLLPSLPNMMRVADTVIKRFGEADKAYRSVITGSIDEELSTADQLTAGLAAETSQVDAEALVERVGQDEAAAAPLTEGELDLLRKDLDDDFSFNLLKGLPLQARRALATIERGLLFKVGPDGDLIFEYGPELKAEESQALEVALNGISPEGNTDLFKRLSARPDVARFFIDMAYLGREALKTAKTEAGVPMFSAKELQKMNLVKIFTTVHAGSQTAAGLILQQANANLATYSDSSSLSQKEARTILKSLLSEAVKPAEVRGRAAPPTAIAEQRAQEKVAKLKAVLDATQGSVDFSKAELDRLKERDTKLKGKADAIREQIKQPNANVAQLQRELNKLVGAISTNQLNIAETEQNLRDSSADLEVASKEYAAVTVRKAPPPPAVMVAEKAKVDEALKTGEKKAENKRRQKTSPAPTKAVNAGLAMTPETPTPVNTEAERSMFKSELAAIGLTTGTDAAGIAAVLRQLALKEGTGSQHFKALARIFSDNAALMGGISGVEIVENPALAADVSVVNGVLTFNVAAMTPTVDGTPRGPEALLRGLITHATKSLTAPDAVLNTNQRKALEKLEALRQEAIAMEPGTRAPGMQPQFTDALKDTASFVEAMLTSPEFGEMLQSYKTSVKSPSLKSAWGRFWSAVGELLTGKVVAFGSTLHVGLMNAGALMTSSPCPGKRFLDSIKAIIHNPEIAFPKTRTASAKEIAHQQRVNEAVEVADSPASLETVEDRLLGDDSEAADPEGTSEGNAALMPDNSMLGSAPATAEAGEPRVKTAPHVVLLLTEQSERARMKAGETPSAPASDEVSATAEIVDEEAIPFAEPYIEVVVEDGSKQPIDFSQFMRRAAIKIGRRIVMVDAGPSVPEQPLYVRHDRADNVIYMNKSAMTGLIETLRSRGYNSTEMTAHLNTLLDREASTLAILQRFSDGELLATARSLTDAQRRKIINRVYGLKPGDPDFMRYFSTGRSGASQDVTADMIQLGADYYRMMRQVSETGHTTEDVMEALATSPGTFARTIAFLKASARQFMTWWRAYGDVDATRAIVNIESFIRATTPAASPMAAPTKQKMAKHEAVKIVANNTGLTVEEVLADVKMVKRIRKSMKQHVVGGDSPETTRMTVADARAFVNSLGLTNRDPQSVATALGRIADMDSVNPAFRVIARQLSQNPQVKALTDFHFAADEVTLVNGEEVKAAGLYDHVAHTLSLEMPFMIEELTSFTSAERTSWSQTSVIEVLIHEAVHAVTARAVRAYSSGKEVSPEIKDAVEGLRGLRAAIANQKGAEKFEYILSNVDEFVAGVSSDPNFVAWLAELPASVGASVPGETDSTSLIKRILRRIYQIIFPKMKPDSVLEKSLSRVFDLSTYPHLGWTPTKAFLNQAYKVKLANTALRRQRELAQLAAAAQEIEAQTPGFDAETAALEAEMSAEFDEFDIDPEDELVAEGEAYEASMEAIMDEYAAKLSKEVLFAPMKAPPTAVDAEYTQLLEGGDSGTDNLKTAIKDAPAKGRAKAVEQWAQRNPKAAAALQQMADSAAKAAGYAKKMLHRTNAKTAFDVFDIEGSEMGAHFGTEAQIADIPKGKLPDKTYYIDAGKSFRMEDDGGFQADLVAEALLREGLVDEEFEMEVMDARSKKRSQKMVREKLEELGYNSIIYLNRYEGVNISEEERGTDEYEAAASSDEAFVERYPQASDSVLVLKPTQIKSADSVTFDAQGNVIPLSQRFQTTNPSVLYAPMKTPPTARSLPGRVTGERKTTEALKNSLPAMPARVQDYLKESTYFSEVSKSNLELINGLIGPHLATASGPADFRVLHDKLDAMPFTDAQRFLARVVVGAALNRRIFDLQEAMIKSATPGGLGMLEDYEGAAKDVWHTVQNISSTSGQMLSAAAIARDLINPKYVAATYRDAATKVAATKLPKDAKDIFTDLQKEADDVAAAVVKKSKLTKKIVEAVSKASGGDPAETQMMFDFMESLQDYLDRGTGVPIPAKMADWVADQMLGMVDAKVRAGIKAAAAAAGESEQTFFEEYSNEVKRQVAQRINQALLEVAPAAPEMTPAQREAAKKEALNSAIREMIASFEFAPSVERALNQSKAKLLANLEAKKGSTPEALKQYDAAKAAIAAMTFDLVPLSKATAIVRKSFDMREQVYLSMSEQRANVAQLAAMISNSAGLNAEQSRKVAEAFKAAYEAEMNRRVQKTLTNYATRRSMSEGRGAAERYSRSERFLRLARIGGLRQEEFYNAMATEFDLPSYDPAVADELDREAQRILAMPVGSVQRNDATQALNARIVNETYKSLLAAYGAKAVIKDRGMMAEYFAGVPVAMWKSGVLSGFGTSEVNLIMGTFQSIMDLGFNSMAYAIKAKDPALATGNMLTLMRAVAWIGDPAARSEVWNEMRRAALTGRTRFASEQSENMLILERDLPAIDAPVVKQVMGSTNKFFKLMGRIGAVVDATVSVPAAIARQRLAMQYALTMSGADRKKIAEIMKKSFSPDEIESREINEILEAEKEQFRNSPRPDLAMESRRYQLMEQRRAQTYAELTSRLDAKSKEDFTEASRESGRFANLGTTPTGLAGALFDGIFGAVERKTKGGSSIIVSFPRAMGNLLDFSLAMSVPGLSFLRAKNLSPSSWFLSEESRYKRELVEKGSLKYHKLMAQTLVATVAQFTIGAFYMYGLEEEKEGRVPWFMVYGKGYPDPERNRQLRYRQPRWAPYTVKIGDLYLSWKDIPGFNLLLGGLAALTDDMMVTSLKDPKKIRGLEAALNTSIGFVKAVTVKNSLQGLAQAGELLSDNTLAQQTLGENAVGMLSNFIGGATNPRLLRDITDIGRGIAGGGEFALKDTRGFTAAAISLLPANSIYGESLGQRDMLNTMGDPVTNFWYAPTTKRILPTSAGPAVDPVITPLVSAGLFLSPVKAGQMSFDAYMDDSDEIDEGGALLSSFPREVEADAIQMFGDEMRQRMTPDFIEELTTLAKEGRVEKEVAQKILNKECEAARALVKESIQERIFNREIVPHWQEK